MQSYVGRFAPSPTGDLHFGSLVAAVASRLQARINSGQWLIRIEDLDPPREVAGSAGRILADLDRFGMHSDTPVLFQSSRLDAYQAAARSLLESEKAFVCTCSRRDLPGSGIYPGTCRNARRPDQPGASIRFRTPSLEIRFIDRVQGTFEQRLDQAVGDFVIRRADGLPAYQLAVVLDDAHQGVTEVVRGADLLDSTPRQIALQSALGLPTPEYLHVPLAMLPDGSKLSKRSNADPVRAAEATTAVTAALRFLGQEPPACDSLEALWDWALQNWRAERIPRQGRLPWSGDVLTG